MPHAVATGYGVDPDVGNSATTTKLLRVALLGPALVPVSAAVAGAAPDRATTSWGFLLLPALLSGLLVLLVASYLLG